MDDDCRVLLMDIESGDVEDVTDEVQEVLHHQSWKLSEYLYNLFNEQSRRKV